MESIEALRALVESVTDPIELAVEFGEEAAEVCEMTLSLIFSVIYMINVIIIITVINIMILMNISGQNTP